MNSWWWLLAIILAPILKSIVKVIYKKIFVSGHYLFYMERERAVVHLYSSPSPDAVRVLCKLEYNMFQGKIISRIWTSHGWWEFPYTHICNSIVDSNLKYLKIKRKYIKFYKVLYRIGDVW